MKTTGTTPQRWGWLWVLCTVAIFNQVVMNLARPVTTYKLIALDFNEVIIGIVAASYAALPLVVALPLGRLIDRTGNVKHLISGGMFITALGGGLLMLGNLATIFAGYTLLGLGQVVFAIASQAAVARYTHSKFMDSGFGWFTAAFSAGQLLGPLIAGFFLGSETNLPREVLLHRVDAALLCSLILTLIAIPIIYLPVRWENILLPAATADHANKQATIGAVLRIPSVASHLFAALCLLVVIDILTSFLPLVGEELGASPQWVAILLAIRAGASLVSRFLLPTLSRHFPREHLLISSLLISAVGIMAATFTIGNVVASGLLMILGGFFLGLGQPITMTLTTQAVPSHWRSTALAVRLLGNRIGQLSLPVIAGALAAGAGPTAAVTLSCVLLAGSGMEKMVRLQRTRRSR